MRAEFQQLVHLTPREREVLSLLGEDRSYKYIAERLVIALSKVKFYTHSLRLKVGGMNRHEPAIFAWKRRFILVRLR